MSRRIALLYVLLAAALSAALAQTLASHTGIKAQRTNSRKTLKKYERMKQMVGKIDAARLPLDAHVKPDTGAAHNKDVNHVVMAAAMNLQTSVRKVNMFAGTLRKTGYDGDIVVAILPGTQVDVVKAFHKYKCIVYTIKVFCSGQKSDTVCSFAENDKNQFSLAMIRFYLYEFWAIKYSEATLMMLSDFSDVLFQSNPFTYRPYDWQPPTAHLAVFLEHHPSKVIERCIFNGGWIRSCYGDEALSRVGTNTVSCSGTTMGVRDAIVVYTHLMTQQLNPTVRYGINTTVTSNKGCLSLGMDQGLHNYLLYSGQLETYMDVKVFQQGEGPVNTIGAFRIGPRGMFTFDLTTWKIMRGVKNQKNVTFHNWNGMKSPAVHQYDRFYNADLGPNDYDNFECAQGLLT